MPDRLRAQPKMHGNELIPCVKRRKQTAKIGHLSSVQLLHGFSHPRDGKQIPPAVMQILLGFPSDHLLKHQPIWSMGHKTQRPHVALDPAHLAQALFDLLGACVTPLFYIGFITGRKIDNGRMMLIPNKWLKRGLDANHMVKIPGNQPTRIQKLQRVK